MATLFRRASGTHYLVSVLHGKRIWEPTGTHDNAEAIRNKVDRKRFSKLCALTVPTESSQRKD